MSKGQTANAGTPFVIFYDVNSSDHVGMITRRSARRRFHSCYDTMSTSSLYGRLSVQTNIHIISTNMTERTTLFHRLSLRPRECEMDVLRAIKVIYMVSNT